MSICATAVVGEGFMRDTSSLPHTQGFQNLAAFATFFSSVVYQKIFVAIWCSQYFRIIAAIIITPIGRDTTWYSRHLYYNSPNWVLGWWYDMIWEKRYVGMGTVVAEPSLCVWYCVPIRVVLSKNMVQLMHETREAVTAHRRAHPKGMPQSFKLGCASLTTCYIISGQCFEPFGCLT